MIAITDLWLFVLTGLLLNATPGPDMAYIVARSTRGGWPSGAAAALGVGAGCLVHVAAGAFGLAAVLAASATAFTLLKLAGAAYLLWLGVALLRSQPPKDNPTEAERPAERVNLAEIFREALLINVFNPKVAIFFLAFIPQFIAADASSKALTFVVLGLIFNVNGTIWNLGIAWSAARAARTFAAGTAFRVWVDRALGAMFIGLGVKLALLQRT